MGTHRGAGEAVLEGLACVERVVVLDNDAPLRQATVL
jgi:hypothetical protein